MRQIFLDTETTGLDPNQGHRVIEIAAVEMNNRQLTSNHFHTYLNPSREIDLAAQEVHGITLEFLKDKPFFKDIASELLDFLKDSEVKVASVSTAFPSGNSSLEVKIQETKEAIFNGADEIDMVISRGKFHSGEYNYVFDEIATIKENCGDKARLKVILETGELGDYDHIRLASEIAIKAGADFIKTSTGKIKPAATLSITLVMLEAIKDHYYSTGKMVGMKPAGGISNSKLALQYLVMVKETLGNFFILKVILARLSHNFFLLFFKYL